MRSFLYAQAAKEPQLYNPRLIGIARGQTAQRLVYGQHFRGVLGQSDFTPAPKVIV